MGTRDIATIGEVSVVAGLLTVIFGVTQWFFVANTGLRSCPPIGCTTIIDYTPLTMPAIIGGALIVAGAWLFWVFKPQDSVPPSPL